MCMSWGWKHFAWYLGERVLENYCITVSIFIGEINILVNIMIEPAKKKKKSIERVDALWLGMVGLKGAFLISLHGTTKHGEESTVI